ncbi:placenta-specific protein 1 [Lepus europaeus]|uniref:placenta-specific protein 1 n=1 Tax=Lepus europaeus TaxID=9983 RepID=UPI002B49D5F7|nr:placenta-specific protein 1 [Lepus europaeus]
MHVAQLVAGTVFLTSVFSACSGQNPMTVLCSIDWFMVTVQPFMLNNDVYVHFYELHLGLGCPANHVQPHAYQFTYRVTECGIKAKAISQDMVIYSTEMHYASVGTSSRYAIPVSCIAPQKSPWFTVPASMTVAGEGGATASTDETGHKGFTLAQSDEVTDHACLPCVVTEQERPPAPYHQIEMEEDPPAQSSPFVDISEDVSAYLT